MEAGDQILGEGSQMADLTPESLDAMDDGDLRKACQMVLKRDIGPITDSTRDLYKLAVKKALMGHPILFDKDNNESNTEIPSDSDYEEIKPKETTQESLPSLSPPTPPRISRNSPLVTKQPFDSSPFTSIKRSFPATAPSPFSPRPKRIEQRSNFLRNAFIVGIGAVLLALVLAFLLSD